MATWLLLSDASIGEAMISIDTFAQPSHQPMPLYEVNYLTNSEFN